MSTATTQPPRSRPAAPSTRSSRLGGWRVALRMAWRDTMAAKGRSALVVALIGLPVLVLVAGLVVAMTGVKSDAERLPETLGSTQASIDSVQGGAVEQFKDGMGTTGTAAPLPTPLRPDSPARAVATAVAPLLPGAHLVPTSSSPLVALGSHAASGTALQIDASDAARPALAPLTELVEGRYPTAADEIAVTRLGVAQGLPTSGTLDARVRGESTRPLTVVGVVDSASEHIGVLALPDAATGPVLVDRAAPVTWADLKELNRYGLVLTSREVVTNPPAEYAGPYGGGGDTAVYTALYGSMLAGLLLEMCLLAGPAFAIGAQRQRRSLALAASNGATRAQLRTVVLAQALVLGALTAALASVTGVLLGVAAVGALGTWWPGLGIRGAADIPWFFVLAIALAAGVACVVAAMVPARGLGRLDVVSVLRGQSVSPRAHRGLPALGLALAAVGGVLVVWPIVTRNSGSAAGASIVVGAFLLVIGAIMTVPMILVALGRLTRGLPIAGRMATRDATRQRGRAVPTAASLIGGAALLAALGTAITSGDRAGERDYRPAMPAGWAAVHGTVTGPGYDEALAAKNAETAAAAVARTLPDARLHRVGYVGDRPQFQMSAPDPATQVAVLGPTCPVERARIAVTDPTSPASAACLALATSGPASPAAAEDSPSPGIVVVDAEAARALYALDDAATTALRDGALLDGTVGGQLAWVRLTTMGTDTDHPRTTLAPGGTVRVVTAPSLAATGPYGQGVAAGPYAQGPATLVTPERAQALGWTVQPQAIYVEQPGGISADEEAATERAVDEVGTGSFDVERGYENALGPVVAAVFGTVGLLSVIAVVVATALSVRESRRDLDTLAAVGASRGIRRRFSAWQAGFLAAVGTLLGYAIGLVPGIALCWPITASPRSVDGSHNQADWVSPPVIVDIPWGAMVLTLGAVVALSALVAAALAGREGRITRRLS